MGDPLPFFSRQYGLFLTLLLVARGLDFLSTYIATPHLALEANPIAKKLGWKWGALVNIAVCITFGLYPLPAIIVSTTSVLVAAHNFEGAWLMHTMGETGYREWMTAQVEATRPSLFLFCLFGKTALWAAVGASLLLFGGARLVPFGVGLGMLGYAIAVLVYSLISIWRLRRRHSNRSG